MPPEHAPIYGTIAEPLASLGFLAARTRRLVLGVSALVVPQRQPLVALKQLTTLDFISGGRIVTAVAAGCGPVGRSSGWPASRVRRCGAPRRRACGTRSRFRRTSCGRWRRRCGSVGPTRASSCGSASFSPEPVAGRDERGRHAIAGPPKWIAERLSEYVEAGADGFVVNLEYDRPSLEERVQRFAEDVWPRIGSERRVS
ncbi:MAG TPA: LLM class flavin-dependent oxidoreductase [Gaiellaceae bacterium]|nr:LLM class flavin-dependent oxidoreductase [Gaiellaceae bacterium]